MKVCMFPGQGSQRVGMGEGLFDEFHHYTELASETLGYCIKTLCLTDPNKLLSKTEYTQPALYVVGVLSYLKHLKVTHEKPSFVIGHSLGEYNALFAAGVFRFDVGLKLVQERGRLMSQASDGGMAAILGANVETVRNILQQNNLHNLDIANINSPSQLVISGSSAQINLAKSIFETRELTFVPLNVSAAFHSRLMEPTKHEFSNYLKQFEFTSPTIPVISNVTAQPYNVGSVKTNIIDQICGTVRWVESIECLLEIGASNFCEIGPGDVLTKITGYIKAAYKTELA